MLNDVILFVTYVLAACSHWIKNKPDLLSSFHVCCPIAATNGWLDMMTAGFVEPRLSSVSKSGTLVIYNWSAGRPRIGPWLLVGGADVTARYSVDSSGIESDTAGASG